MIHFLRRLWPKTLSFHPFRSFATTATAASAYSKLVITPGSLRHNDLPSFLDYAQRTNLSPKTTVYVGTHYEYTVAQSLLRLGFSLIRTGRRSDNGIDLLGHWTIPTLPEPLPVLIQCKAKQSVGPVYVRELEGSFASVPVEWRRKNVLGLLVTTQKASKAVTHMIGMSRWPMGFMKVSKEGVVEQLLWNKSAVERGLEGVGVTLRYASEEDRAKEAEGDVNVEGKPRKIAGDEDEAKVKRLKARKEKVSVKKDIQLTWLGNPIFANRDSLADETVQLGEEISSGDQPPDTEEETPKAIEEIRAKQRVKKDFKDDQSVATKKRGRPRKLPIEETLVELQTKKRGRPRKLPVETPIKLRTRKVASRKTTASAKKVQKKTPTKANSKDSKTAKRDAASGEKN